MTSTELIALFTTIFAIVVAVIYSLRTEKTKKSLVLQEEIQKNSLHEISLFKEIQDKIGYELNREKIIDAITKSLSNMFLISVSASLYKDDHRITLHIKIEDPVNQTFIDDVKAQMLASFAKLTDDAPLPRIEERIDGHITPSARKGLGSFFHVPLVVNSTPIGIITLAVAKPMTFQEEQMTFAYKMVNQAINALSRLETVLATEKEKLTSTITSLADGVFMFDSNLKLFVINTAAKNLLQIKTDSPTESEVIKAFPASFFLTDKLHQALSKNKGIEREELFLKEHTLQVFITPVMPLAHTHTVLPANPVVGVSVLLHDITLEKSLTKMQEDFVNMVVHDLRAPLTSVKDAAALLSTAKTTLSSDDKQLVSLIHTQSQKLLDQVTTLLDTAKLQNGNITPKRNETDINKLVNDQIQVFTPQAQEKNISLVPALDQNLPHIQVDANLFSQVINNLLSNSIKFTQSHGKIGVSTMLEGKNIRIAVSDTGVGIPKEKQTQLFSRFYRAGATTTTPGTGLGLYIVKNIVAAHNGTVKLDSEEGKGTTVTIIIPLAQPLTAR